MTERDAYVAKMKAKLDEWNSELDNLSAQADGIRADAKLEYEDAVTELRARRDEAQHELAKLSAAGESAWDDIRKGADAACENLGAAFKSALSRFKQG